MEELEKILLDLLGFDTQNSDADPSLSGETLSLLNHVRKYFNEEVIEVKISKYECGEFKNRGILIASPREKNSLPNILLQGHVDTVPSGNFQGNFLGESKEGKIYGRGAVDMKGSVACMIFAFKKIIESNKRNFNPVLLLTSDEEAKGFSGIKHFLSINNQRIDFAICGEPSNFKIYSLFKGAVSKEINVFGKAAHGSRPYQGRNAIYDSLEILNLLKLFATYLSEEVHNPKFETSDPNSKRSSLNVGRIVGGIKVNSVPEKCKIEFEIRLVYPKKKYEELIKEKVFDKISPEIKYDYLEKFAFNPFVLEKNRFVLSLGKAVERLGLNVDYGAMVGFSEASFLNHEKIPTIVFGVGDPKYSHSSNEQIEIENLKKYANVLSSFFLD